MNRIYIKDKRLWNDNTPISLVSAEVHYWRLEPSLWETVLRAGMEMGLETIASYVCWHYHEYEIGKFDFTGKTDPKRNLLSYLDLVQSLGLNLLIRPGPYIFAEWTNYGIPDHIAPYHRLHPKFLKAASKYIEQVCEIIRPYQATNGGPIVLCQADNMFDLGQHRYDRQLGFFGGGGSFQEFLKKKYTTVESLNSSWGIDYNEFEEAGATEIEIFTDPLMHNRYLDFLAFKHWFTLEAATWTVSEYRKNGIDVPLYSNATKDQNISQVADLLDLVAFNHYPTKDYTLVSDEHQSLLDHVRLLTTLSPIPYVAELESGIWHGYHYVKGLPHPNHYRYMLLTILAGGAVTWTWYMLHDRDNWYMSPVNSRGQKRMEIFSVFKRFVEIENETKPYEWENCSSTGVTYYPSHDSSYHSALEASEFYSTSKSIYSTGLDHTFYNLQSPGKAPAILFYDGLEWLDRKAQQVLLDYIIKGGNLVILQNFPYLDENKKSCNLLGIPFPHGIDAQGYMNTFYKDAVISLGHFKAKVEVPKSVYFYRQVPGEKLYAKRIQSQKEINDNILEEYQLLSHLGDEENLLIGYHEKRGKGSLTFLGVPPSPDLIIQMHRFLKIPMAVLPLVFGVQVVCYRSSDRHYIIVLNVGLEDKDASVLLDSLEFPGCKYLVKNILEGVEQRIAFLEREPKLLSISLQKKNGVILEIKEI